MKREERIAAMEERLDKATLLMAETEAVLDRFESELDDVQLLTDYYGSKTWFADLKAYEKCKIPEGTRCGVLSEDLVYDAIESRRDIAIRMLEIAVRILKN